MCSVRSETKNTFFVSSSMVELRSPKPVARVRFRPGVPVPITKNLVRPRCDHFFNYWRVSMKRKPHRYRIRYFVIKGNPQFGQRVDRPKKGKGSYVRDKKVKSSEFMQAHSYSSVSLP